MDNNKSAKNELSDVLGRIRSGDGNAFDELCRMYSSLTENAVKRFAPSFNSDGGDSPLYGADDLNQIATLALYRAAQTYVESYGTVGVSESGTVDTSVEDEDCSDVDDRSNVADGGRAGANSVSFGLYARICVNNALISALRKSNSEKKRQKRVREKTEAASNDPLNYIIDSERRLELMDRIDSVLSKFEKEVFNLYITGKSAHEIAEELHRDDKSVSNAIYRTKVKVKGLLKNQ